MNSRIYNQVDGKRYQLSKTKVKFGINPLQLNELKAREDLALIGQMITYLASTVF